MQKCHLKETQAYQIPASYKSIYIATYWNGKWLLLRCPRPRAQRRNARTNAAITAFPVLLCVLLVSIQHVVDSELERPPFRCGCAGPDQCGIQHSTPIQALACAVPVPPRWPALLQVPATEARALTRLRPRPCKAPENCPATVLLTGQNRLLAQGTVQAEDYFLRGRLTFAFACAQNHHHRSLICLFLMKFRQALEACCSHLSPHSTPDACLVLLLRIPQTIWICSRQ
jgi:hypothetical protein